MARRYEMAARSQAMRRTREQILDAAVRLFTPAWFDEVTLADVAAAAGVSQQTVANHFGTKADLFLAGLQERWAEGAVAVRDRATVGDVDSIVAAVMDDYERNGEAGYRIQVLADRLPELRELVAQGRAFHRGFVERVFAPQLAGRARAERARMVEMLAAVLDVKMWRELRVGQGLSAVRTREHLGVLTSALVGGGR